MDEGKEDCGGCANIFSRCKTLWGSRLAVWRWSRAPSFACRGAVLDWWAWSLMVGREMACRSRARRPTFEGARVCVRWHIVAQRGTPDPPGLRSAQPRGTNLVAIFTCQRSGLGAREKRALHYTGGLRGVRIGKMRIDRDLWAGRILSIMGIHMTQPATTGWVG